MGDINILLMQLTVVTEEAWGARMAHESARERSDRIRREIRDLTDRGLSQQEILSLFYMRSKWRNRLTAETTSDSSPSQIGRD